jgi:hypothetical protein
MTSTLPLVTLAVVTFLFNDDFKIKLKSSLKKNVTTARVTSGKVEVITK